MFKWLDEGDLTQKDSCLFGLIKVDSTQDPFSHGLMRDVLTRKGSCLCDLMKVDLTQNSVQFLQRVDES